MKRDAWVVQAAKAAKHLPLAQVMIPGFWVETLVGLLAQRGACFSLCLPLFLLVRALSLSLPLSDI